MIGKTLRQKMRNTASTRLKTLPFLAFVATKAATFSLIPFKNVY